MTKLSKLGIVLGGYAAAFLVSCAAFYIWTRFETIADMSGGMQAFGDSLLFAGLFGFLSLAPTAAALYFVRSYLKLWTLLSIASLTVATTAPIAALMIPRTPKPPSLLMLAGFFGLMEVFASPLFGLCFLLAAAIAPERRPRWILAASAGLEFVVGAYAFYCMWVVGRWVL